MQFKKWLNEIVYPQKPSQPKKSTIIKNKSTNTERPVLQYSWTTSLGNKVKLHFDKTDENEYIVIFYVNDTHYDDETSGENRTRDPEVLNTVIYMMKKKADELGMNKLSFTGQDSPKDYRKIFNLPLEPHKTNLISNLQNLTRIVQSRTPQMMYPTQNQINLFTKLKRPIPEPKLDFDPVYLTSIKKMIEEIESNKKVDSSNFSFFNLLKNIGFDSINLEKQIDTFNRILDSQTEQGWNRYKNRRAEVFEKLTKKFFGDWKIERSGSRINLTRQY